MGLVLARQHFISELNPQPYYYYYYCYWYWKLNPAAEHVKESLYH